MAFSPCLVRADGDSRGLIRIGHPLLDAYGPMASAATPSVARSPAHRRNVTLVTVNAGRCRGEVAGLTASGRCGDEIGGGEGRLACPAR